MPSTLIIRKNCCHSFVFLFFFFFNATFKFGFGFWYDFFLFGLHFFVCFTQFLFYFCWEPKEPKEKRIARWGNFPAQVFFYCFSFGFSYSFFCCISVGFLGTSLRASQKQLGRLLLIVLFEYFTAGIAATLRLMASLVVTPLGGGRSGIYLFCSFFCLFVC